MKRVLLFACIIFLLLPLSLLSQSKLEFIEPSWELDFVEPSWDLMPGEPAYESEQTATNIIETKDGCYIVPLFGKQTKIIKFNDDGEVLQEIELQYNKNFICGTIDNYNDTVNVFTLDFVKEGECAEMIFKHAYLFEDFSMSEPKELWRKEFSEDLDELSLFNTPILIDNNGCRTFLFQTLKIAKSVTDVFLKLDANLNVVAERIYDDWGEMYNSIFGNCNLMYNADSTQYYYLSYSFEYPYFYFMNVLDTNLNLLEKIPFESDPIVYLQAFSGDFRRNPYDGKIYALGYVDIPYPYNIRDEIVAFKIDFENGDVDFLRLSNTYDRVNYMSIYKNLCFSPDGKIIGCAIYDIAEFLAYKPDAYYAYLPVFNSNMKKVSEWFFTLGHKYNYIMYYIHNTKNNDIILLGNIRYMMDDEIYWEPYIVKFPASAFDPENIEEAHAHGLHLAVAYPNPGGDVMNIRTGLRNAVLSVYDINGRKIYEQEITDDITSVDASKWQSGTYVWKLGVRNEELGMKEVESGKWIK